MKGDRGPGGFPAVALGQGANSVTAGQSRGPRELSEALAATPSDARLVREALSRRGLIEAHESRLPYQRNDCIGWIMRAKRPETKDRRLKQMLDELAAADRYMKMPYRARYSDARHGAFMRVAERTTR